MKKGKCRKSVLGGITVVAALAAATAATAAAPPPSGKVEPAPAAKSSAGPQRNPKVGGAECPPGLACVVAPAAYAQNSADPGD